MTVQIGEVKTVNFPCEPWKISGDTMADFRIGPIPGTWTLAPELLLKRGIKALLSCPNCRHAALIRPDMGELINGVLEIKAFRCSNCGMACHCRLQTWDKNKLFCIAYEALDTITGLPMVDSKGDTVRKEYMHAETRNLAFNTFVEVRRFLGRFRVIDVGEVVGFFGLESDKDQKNLTV